MELAVIDSPLIQRLRNIHQVGLVHKIYPSAHHTRFEHTLGVVIVASRVFDALAARSSGKLEGILKVLFPNQNCNDVLVRLKQEVRLAALLHDCGHSLYSHTSEKVYQGLDVLREATDELSDFVGKEKGAGEVISFCIAKTNSLQRLLRRAKEKLETTVPSDELPHEIDPTNVALLIVGRAIHPYVQFLGDIVSSGLDADKLDYLLRDATAAGLPYQV